MIFREYIRQNFNSLFTDRGGMVPEPGRLFLRFELISQPSKRGEGIIKYGTRRALNWPRRTLISAAPAPLTAATRPVFAFGTARTIPPLDRTAALKRLFDGERNLIFFEIYL